MMINLYFDEILADLDEIIYGSDCGVVCSER